jgi:hypothetical protein
MFVRKYAKVIQIHIKTLIKYSTYIKKLSFGANKRSLVLAQIKGL